MSKKRLLFAASEVYPFAKSGGLADVAHSLPRALSGEYDVHVKPFGETLEKGYVTPVRPGCLQFCYSRVILAGQLVIRA
jgi:starch synthase